MQTIKQFVTPLLATMLVSAPVLAQDGSASAGLSLSHHEDGASASSSAEGSAEGGYMSKYRPESNLVELGMFAGMMFPSDQHNLHDENLPHMPYDPAALELGARLGYFPLAFLGLEGEGAVLPTDTEDGNPSILYAARGHLVAQLPFWSITPFLLAGGGALGTNSGRLGNDMDPAMHFGAGVKVPVNETMSIRFDVRDTMSQKDDEDDGVQTHHPELLLGFTHTFGRTKEACPPAAPPDADADGIPDLSDQCPGQPGPGPTGCPPPPDSDADGLADELDKCPEQAGPAPEGCPPPPDTDGDGLVDANDKCPNEPAKEPDGCPNLDADGDGVSVDKDKCPEQPETKNGFEDSDGCPDELPEVVKKFNGVMPGIQFDFGKATIRPVSRAVLDDAAKTLTEYPELKVLITGHTDDVGPRDKNLKLSADRAESVKTYLVGKGVAEARVSTKGAGPDQPLTENDSEANRQKNRRIEFAIVAEQ